MTEMAAPRRALPAMHPGELLREVVLPSLGRTVTDVAASLHVSRQTLHAILREEAPVTPAMALRIGKLCGNGPAVWLNLQMAWDIERLSVEMADELATIPTLDAA